MIRPIWGVCNLARMRTPVHTHIEFIQLEMHDSVGSALLPRRRFDASTQERARIHYACIPVNSRRDVQSGSTSPVTQANGACIDALAFKATPSGRPQARVSDRFVLDRA